MPLQGVDEFDVPLGNADIPTLAVPFIGQDGDELCWAACAQMIRALYREAWAQCEIVTVHFRVDCCTPPPPPLLPEPDCDVPLPSDELITVFEEIGLRATLRPGVPTFALLEKEITDGRPVQVGLRREDGTAHLVVVVGAGLMAGVEWVKYHDPLEGVVSLPYDSLLAQGAVEAWIGIEEQ